MKPQSVLLILAAAAGISACGESKSAEAASKDTRHDSAGGLVIAPSTPYRPNGAETSTALVVNLVADSTSPPVTPSCKSDDVSEAGTVFWVDGIREGKPLPNERRYSLVNGSCGIQPHLQATVVGGAVNVFNDVGLHRLVFVRAGTTDTLQVMPFTNTGAVVASDRLTKTPGVVEVRCTIHPNESAHIAVFDHPYFGVASAGEKVTLDSVPAGDYRVMTWHEGLAAPASVPAKVGPTGSTEIILK
jgi:hypothetical protein